jgi:hypothetical protein
VYVRPGVQGLSMLTPAQYVASSPGLHGQRFTGWRGLPRDVFLPVTIQPEDGGWLTVARDFFAGLRPDEEGTLTVIPSDGVPRTLGCRFVDDSSQAYDIDPALFEREVVGLNLVADDPWWKGPAVKGSYSTPAASSPFFSPSGSASVLTISPGGTLASATITNPGDVPAWPLWTVRGPVTAFSIGYGASLLTATVALADGESLVIDTDPRVQAVRQQPSGVLVPFSQFSSIEFAPIPAGESVALSLTLTGTGAVDVSFAPRYFRAF